MDENVKKPLMVVVVIVCLLAAGYLVLKNFSGADKDTEIDEAFAPDEMTWLMCDGCGHTYQMNTSELHKIMQENIDPATMNARPLTCPKCGAEKCYKAIKCEECGEVFYEGSVPNTYSDTCPKCKFSKSKKAREEAAR
jgi:hypothetical protein